MALTFTYEWLRDGIPINGATSPNYVVTDADAGHTLTFEVSGQNGYGATVAISLPFAIPAAAPTPPTLPVNTVAPAITSATVGISTIASTGTWTGTAPITYTYQWYLDGAVIVGQTSNAYTPISGDIGKSLYCIVTGTNLAGHASAQSNSQTVVSGGSYINVPDAATLSTILAAGPIASGGKSYLLAGTNFGGFGFYNFDFSSNPITITGQTNFSSVFNTMNFSNTGGMTFNTIKVIGHGSPNDSDSSIEINNSNSSFVGNLIFNQVVTTSSQAEGTQVGGGWFLRNIYNQNITIVGQNDATKPDISGRTYDIAVIDTGWNGGTLTIRNMTFTNSGINQIQLAGAQNVTINHNLFGSQYWGVGDHPNVIHLFGGTGAVSSQNVTITNNGMTQGATGGGAITILQEDAFNVLVQNNWTLMGVFFDAYENARGSGCTYDNNFAQGISSVGGSMLVRGGAINCTTTNNTVTNASPFTYGPEAPYPGYSTSGNVITSPASASAWNDWTALNVWLASNPTARAHP